MQNKSRNKHIGFEIKTKQAASFFIVEPLTGVVYPGGVHRVVITLSPRSATQILGDLRGEQAQLEIKDAFQIEIWKCKSDGNSGQLIGVAGSAPGARVAGQTIVATYLSSRCYPKVEVSDDSSSDADELHDGGGRSVNGVAAMLSHAWCAIPDAEREPTATAAATPKMVAAAAADAAATGAWDDDAGSVASASSLPPMPRLARASSLVASSPRAARDTDDFKLPPILTPSRDAVATAAALASGAVADDAAARLHGAAHTMSFDIDAVRGAQRDAAVVAALLAALAARRDALEGSLIELERALAHGAGREDSSASKTAPGWSTPTVGLAEKASTTLVDWRAERTVHRALCRLRDFGLGGGGGGWGNPDVDDAAAKESGLKREPPARLASLWLRAARQSLMLTSNRRNVGSWLAMLRSRLGDLDTLLDGVRSVERACAVAAFAEEGASAEGDARPRTRGGSRLASWWGDWCCTELVLAPATTDEDAVRGRGAASGTVADELERRTQYLEVQSTLLWEQVEAQWTYVQEHPPAPELTEAELLALPQPSPRSERGFDDDGATIWAQSIAGYDSDARSAVSDPGYGTSASDPLTARSESNGRSGWNLYEQSMQLTASDGARGGGAPSVADDSALGKERGEQLDAVLLRFAALNVGRRDTVLEHAVQDALAFRRCKVLHLLRRGVAPAGGVGGGNPAWDAALRTPYRGPRRGCRRVPRRCRCCGAEREAAGKEDSRRIILHRDGGGASARWRVRGERIRDATQPKGRGSPRGATLLLAGVALELAAPLAAPLASPLAAPLAAPQAGGAHPFAASWIAAPQVAAQREPRSFAPCRCAEAALPALARRARRRCREQHLVAVLRPRVAGVDDDVRRLAERKTQRGHDVRSGRRRGRRHRRRADSLRCIRRRGAWVRRRARRARRRARHDAAPLVRDGQRRFARPRGGRVRRRGGRRNHAPRG